LELEARVKAVGEEDAVVGTVTVSAIYSVGLHDMSGYVKLFEERYPAASARLEYLHPRRVLERVTGGEAELGILSYPRKWPDLNVITWREEPMVLVVHPSHRFANQTSVSVADLGGEPFVAFDADLSIRRAIDRFLRHHSVPIDVVLEFDNIENIKRAVEIPSGIAILPEPSLLQEIKAGSLVAIPIQSPDPAARLTRPLAIIHRRHDNLDPAGAKFLQLLTSEELTSGEQISSRPNKRFASSST
jgi:DNA-binding transcriptional LysR family regulator